jgi:hypothetical protein
MIGKSLSDRHGRGFLPDEQAVALMNEMLASHAAPLVQVRAQDARMVACLIVRADEPAVRLCRSLGFEMKLNGTGVLGLLGADAARFFAHLPSHQRAWLEAPCATRETKVVLLAGGTALISLETRDGKVVVTPVPREPAREP